MVLCVTPLTHRHSHTNPGAQDHWCGETADCEAGLICGTPSDAAGYCCGRDVLSRGSCVEVCRSCRRGGREKERGEEKEKVRVKAKVREKEKVRRRRRRG